MITPQVSVTLVWPKVPWLSLLVFPKLPWLKADGPEGLRTFCSFKKACTCCLLHIQWGYQHAKDSQGPFLESTEGCAVDLHQGERENSHVQPLKIWPPLLDKFCSCHAVGLWEWCRTSSVTLNAGGYLGVTCLGRSQRLGLKGTSCGPLR